jgi:hypothetical protein
VSILTLIKGGGGIMLQCSKCGGEIIGNGYTSIMHCENADEDTYWFEAPDQYIECTYEEPQKVLTDRQRISKIHPT